LEPTTQGRPSHHLLLLRPLPKPLLPLMLSMHHLLPPPYLHLVQTLSFLPLLPFLLLSHRCINLQLRLFPQIQARPVRCKRRPTKRRRLQRLRPLMVQRLMAFLLLPPLLLFLHVAILVSPTFHFFLLLLSPSHLTLFTLSLILSILLISAHAPVMQARERAAERPIVRVMGLILCLSRWRLRERRQRVAGVRIGLQG